MQAHGHDQSGTKQNWKPLATMVKILIGQSLSCPVWFGHNAQTGGGELNSRLYSSCLAVVCSPFEWKCIGIAEMEQKKGFDHLAFNQSNRITKQSKSVRHFPSQFWFFWPKNQIRITGVAVLFWPVLNSIIKDNFVLSHCVHFVRFVHSSGHFYHFSFLKWLNLKNFIQNIPI